MIRVDTMPYSNVHRASFVGETFYIEADEHTDRACSGEVRMSERRGSFTMLAFQHPNPIGAAQTLAAALYHAEATTVRERTPTP